MAQIKLLLKNAERGKWGSNGKEGNISLYLVG